MLKKLLFLLFVMYMVITKQAIAFDAEDLYIATIKTNSASITSENQKKDLIINGFIQLLKKITGKQIDINIFGTDSLDQYINKYEYQDQSTLKIHFDKHLINNVLIEHGYSFFQDFIPTTIVWPKYVNSITSDLGENLFKEIATISKERGLSIVYPVMDLKEIEILNKNQNIQEIKNLSRKYEVDEIIIADFQEWGSKLNVNYRSIINSWELKDSIINTSNDCNRGANLFLDQLLEYLLKTYANNKVNKIKEVFLINISNVVSLQDYVNVEHYLQNLSIINSIKATKFQAGEVEFEVTVKGDKQAIKKLIATKKFLKEIENNTSYSNENHEKANQGNKLFYTLCFG